jgi:aldehyde dehydrogenase (NAD+)
MTTYQNFIGGEWMKSSASKSAPNVNPANTDDVIGDIPLASREEARRAVEAAADAFPKWRSTPAPTRGRIVAQAARLLEQNKEELAQSLTREEGKTIAESRGELQRSINVADFCAGESRRTDGRNDPFRITFEFRVHNQTALGCCRVCDALEFSGGDSRLEDRPCVSRGQQCRL